MIKTKDVLIPDIGEFDEVEVIEVLVKSGDTVSAEDSLLTMESDKASMDVPSPFGGIVKIVKIKAGDKVSQNDLILTLSVEGDETSSLEKTPKETSISETSLDATSTQKNSIEVTYSSETAEFNVDSGIRSKPEKLGTDNAHSYTVLGTDGYGRSDSREALRKHFEVDRYYIALAALNALCAEGSVSAKTVKSAIKQYGIDTGKTNPLFS